MKNKEFVSEKDTKTTRKVSEALKTKPASVGENPIEVRMLPENNADENYKTVRVRYIAGPLEQEVVRVRYIAGPLEQEVVRVRFYEVPPRQVLYRVRVLPAETNSSQQTTKHDQFI